MKHETTNPLPLYIKGEGNIEVKVTTKGSQENPIIAIDISEKGIAEEQSTLNYLISRLFTKGSLVL